MRSKELQTILILTMLLSLSALEDKIFPKYICDARCGANRSIIHTYCGVPKTCGDFRNFDMQETRFSNMKSVLIIAHNGLRNRLAGKMKATDVLYMKWDKDLSLMASNFQRRCLSFRRDACAAYKTGKVTLERLASGLLSPSFRNVVQNTYFRKTSIAQYNFIEMGLRHWYAEQSQLAPPEKTQVRNESFLQIIGENNFTHIVAPQLNRFGCSTSRYHGGFSLICYYYPYYRTKKSAVLFKMRTPDSQCPHLYPIPDDEFPNLCTKVRYSGAQRWLLDGSAFIFVLLHLGFVGWPAGLAWPDRMLLAWLPHAARCWIHFS